jgi:hypothetical protein
MEWMLSSSFKYTDLFSYSYWPPWAAHTPGLKTR